MIELIWLSDTNDGYISNLCIHIYIYIYIYIYWCITSNQYTHIYMYVYIPNQLTCSSDIPNEINQIQHAIIYIIACHS